MSWTLAAHPCGSSTGSSTLANLLIIRRLTGIILVIGVSCGTLIVGILTLLTVALPVSITLPVALPVALFITLTGPSLSFIVGGFVVFLCRIIPAGRALSRRSIAVTLAVIPRVRSEFLSILSQSFFATS